MIRIRNESDLRNWFKQHYKRLGFSKIIKSSKGYPDFVMLEGDKEVKVELEIKSSNFNLHKHPIDKVDKVICIIEDAKLNIPIIKVKGIKLIKWGDKDSFYSIKRQVYNLFKNKGVEVLTTSEVAILICNFSNCFGSVEVLTTSEVASLLNVSWNTAEKALLELTIEEN